MVPAKPQKTQEPVPAERAWPFWLGRLRDEFDEMFERLSQAYKGFITGPEGWRWGIEVKEEDDAIIVRAEAPGFSPEEIDVQVTEDRLVIKAAKKEEKKEKEGPTEIKERSCFESISLPAGINKDKVEAGYHNGVLTVTLPKTEKAKGRKVPIKAV
jgi:HSP20 family protein